METEEYFEVLDEEIKKVYSVAEFAKSKGLDPVNSVEVPLAKTMAAKCIGLISAIYPQIQNCGIDTRILELEEKYGKLDTTVAFQIAEEVAKQKFCEFDSQLQAIDAGIRIGFAYITIAVVSPPIEGFTELKLGKTRDGKDYFKAYFSGPIRAAGTTASCVVLILIDYLRELFGYAKYDPSVEEIKRYVTENHDYHERVTNLQYMPTDEEITFLAERLPIQIAGEPSEKLEVSNYKNLDRIETNNIRGGMCLIFSEGLAQKAAKGYRLLEMAKKNGIKATGFNFLEEYIELHEKRNKSLKDRDNRAANIRPAYIQDIVAGRPIFGHPSASGAFRFRYGRSRVSGFSGTSIHPATMGISDGFLAVGTQLKLEKPTKGTIVTACDSIEGPIVKLKNGSVKKLKTLEEGKSLYKEVDEIIYLGDLLVPFSDVVNRRSPLLKPGYVEEWWSLELKEKNPELVKKINYFDIGLDEAMRISRENRIPLHPNHTFFWTQISLPQFLKLIDWLKYARISKKIIFPYSKLDAERFVEGKRALELLGVEHEVTIENVVIRSDLSKALFVNLGIDPFFIDKDEWALRDFDFTNIENAAGSCGKVLEAVNKLSEFEIKDRAGDFVGSRMGRPEKAKLRKLTGSPNVLFPVGKEGGRLRSVYEAVKGGVVRSEFPINFCEACNKETIYSFCDICGAKTKKMYYCRECDAKGFSPCEQHQRSASSTYQALDIKSYFENARSKIGVMNSELPPLIKGIRGMSSSGKEPENLAKGILRAKHNLQVNKDGTVRFDATELPVTSFKPKEVSVSIEKLRELGYTRDVFGKSLEDENQILELMPHDVFLPCSPDGTDERADNVFLRVANFIDDLLVKFYKQEPFYNVKTREDLVGKLGVFMAPHNCAGVICRIIGFSQAQGLYASPYMHAAVRRDCDGDEAAIMMLLDVLLNFSKKFLPSHRGGTQDAPLVLNGRINAGEVDDQILDMEMLDKFEYPLELYRLAEQRRPSSEVKIPNVRLALKEGKNPFVNIGFSHDTDNFNRSVACSSYKSLGTMQEKVEHQMRLVEKIRAVDTTDTVKLVLERHFIRDLRGNLRQFSMQSFRCVNCNEIVRRPPLTGRCPVCRGKLIFTVNEGGIKKYLEPALMLSEKYHLSTYLRQNISLIKMYIDSIFGKEPEKQESLAQWF